MAVEIACVAGVELARTGQWSASTGVTTITRADLAEAIAALECPGVRDPIIKLGHTDPRFDGQPAIGRVTNLEVVDEYSLRGDMNGMPGWLGEIIASAYPSRSIEAEWNHQCSIGHTHPFVLTGLSLLGVTAPAIASLDDIAAWWNVDTTTQAAEVIAAKKGTVMPKNIAASATVEDIRRAYYDTASYDFWVEEIQLAPLQLIVVNDIDGSRLRVPVTVDPERDGQDAIVFGEAVPVVVRYDDVPPPPAPEQGADPAAVPITVAASSLRFASRADSLREVRARNNSEGGDMAGSKRVAAAAPGSGDANPGGLTDDQLAKLREAVGLTDDADPAVLASALEAVVTKVKADDSVETGEEETTDETSETDTAETEEEDPEKKRVAVAASVKPKQTADAPQTVTVDAAAFSEMQATVGRFAQFEREQAEKRADEMVDAAFAAGKIARPSVAAYKTLARKDFAGTKQVLDSLAASSAFPVGQVGHSVDAEPTTDVSKDATYQNWSI
ncbi:capsid maturation protease [Gordonia phage Ruthy]|uniref:Capsid maturation protease n=1 Tax=Gordonia phage Ruthy TaxID=2250323 RepID=A0A345L5B5_9CAUD|nr:head maturation protease [Gordonia phage Ruthy]AXH50467.1 capsid maturation protease [Gordonia phage Ruthy]